MQIFTNKNAFVRIIDNILSNACKYNTLESGYIKISLNEDILIIKDNAKGIKNTTRIFDRYFKENKRGIGIGLHIVKKLCTKLDIEVSLKSKYKVGTEFKFDLNNILY